MNKPAWIAASLLALFAVHQVWAEQPGRPPQDLKGDVPPPLRPDLIPGQPSRRDLSQPGQQGQTRLTPDERRKLRRDVNEAGRRIYRRDGLPRPL